MSPIVNQEAYGQARKALARIGTIAYAVPYTVGALYAVLRWTVSYGCGTTQRRDVHSMMVPR